jgi:hypothetical protein
LLLCGKSSELLDVTAICRTREGIPHSAVVKVHIAHIIVDEVAILKRPGRRRQNIFEDSMPNRLVHRPRLSLRRVEVLRVIILQRRVVEERAIVCSRKEYTVRIKLAYCID